MLVQLILNLLREESSGYDLKLLLQNKLPHVWKAELAQIYPTLQKLESEGLIAGRSDRSKAGPGRKLYIRTPAGERRLLDWLENTPPNVAFDRNPLFVHLLIAGTELNAESFKKLISEVEAGFSNLRETALGIATKSTNNAEAWLAQLAAERADASAGQCRLFGAKPQAAPKIPEPPATPRKPRRPSPPPAPQQPTDFIGRFD